MTVTLKMVSFADLLQIGGNGGVGGDIVRKASVHAGLAVPTTANPPTPPDPSSGDGWDAQNSGGDEETQYPCGFARLDPTIPTDPTISEQEVNGVNDTADWRELARAYHRHHWNCRTCIAAGKGYGLRCGVGAALWRAYAE